MLQMLHMFSYKAINTIT